MRLGRRVAVAAKRRFGFRAHLTDDLVAGWPVVTYKGHRLGYRVHTVEGAYFRLLVRCQSCQKELVWRDHYIRGRRDLRRVLKELQSRPMICGDCLRAPRPQPDRPTWPAWSGPHP